MSPRTGRPTDDPKILRLEMRLGGDHRAMLDYCAEVLKLPRAEIVRRGIEQMYQEAINKQKEE